jgi:hypothetical protein
MVRTTHTLTIMSLLLLSACPSADNNVGTFPRDSGGAGGASPAPTGTGGGGGTAGCVEQGVSYAIGDSFKDDCNTCTCGLWAGKPTIACTLMWCADWNTGGTVGSGGAGSGGQPSQSGGATTTSSGAGGHTSVASGGATTPGGNLGSGGSNTGGAQGNGGTISLDAPILTVDSPLAIPVGTMVTTGSMNVERTGGTATLLGNGKVLVAGGRASLLTTNPQATASAELYDPETGTFTATSSMTVPREGHTATLLTDGKVLITGGYSYAQYLAGAETFDPETGIFTTSGSMNGVRIGHTATLLGNGQVLIAGGSHGFTRMPDAGPDDGYVYPAIAELYDPTSRTFAATGSLAVARTAHTATLLASGKVLIAGGGVVPGFSDFVSFASAEVFDPASGTFTTTASMATARAGHSATRLANGKVLVAGGGVLNAITTAEIFDPSTVAFSITGELNEARSGHTATLLQSGMVLVASMGTSAELYDPVAGIFVDTHITGAGGTATLLQNGSVLLAGGGSNSAKLYIPATSN